MLPAVALVLLALAGCTFVAPQPTPEPEEPYSIDQAAVLEVLGAVPEGEPMTPERTADFITRSLDRQWEGVVAQYPDAIRPEVAAEVINDVNGEAFRACMAPVEGGGRESALAAYICSARFPSAPSGMLTHDQAGYLYDYWTGFVMPCYAENGYPLEQSPPARADFVAEWPFQNWSPRPTSLGGEELIAAFEELDLLCPSVVDELR